VINESRSAHVSLVNELICIIIAVQSLIIAITSCHTPTTGSLCLSVYVYVCVCVCVCGTVIDLASKAVVYFPPIVPPDHPPRPRLLQCENKVASALHRRGVSLRLTSAFDLAVTLTFDL